MNDHMPVDERPRTPTNDAKFVIGSLRRGFDKELPGFKVVGRESESAIDVIVAQMRRDRVRNARYWEDRAMNDSPGGDPEGLPFNILCALAACAYCVAAQKEDRLPKPNRAWEYMGNAFFWYGFFGGQSDLSDYLAAKKKVLAERAASVRHAENRAMKQQVIAWFQEHGAQFRSKDAAAAAIAWTVVPLPFRTVRDYLKGLAPKGQ